MYIRYADGRPAMVAAPSGVYLYAFDPMGRMITESSPTGVVTQTWTLRGQLASVQRTGEGTVEYSYNADGTTAWVEDALNRRTNFGYDLRGRRTTVTDANNKVWTTGLNDAGEVTSQTDPLNRTTSYTYDPAGRVATVADPSGRTTTNTWRTDGLLDGWSATGGTITQTGAFTYDSAGRRVTATLDTSTGPGWDDQTWTYTYGPGNDLTSVTDSSGRRLAYTYDTAGRRTGLRRVDGTGVAYSYDSYGRLDKITPTETLADSFTATGGKPDSAKWTSTPAAGGVAQISSNKAVLGVPATPSATSSMAAKVPANASGSSTFSYRFDSTATPATMRVFQKHLSATDNYMLEISSNSNTAWISRTLWGWPAHMTSFTVPVDTDTHRVRFEVNGLAICAKVWNDGDVEPAAWNACVNDWFVVGTGTPRIELGNASGAGNQVHIDDFSHTVPGTAPSPLVDYSWNAAGQLTGEALPGGASRTWTWTGGRLTKLAQTAPGATRTTDLTYDTAGRIATEATAGVTTTYGYDNAGQLLSSTPSSGTASAWTYDTLGRRATQTVGAVTTTYVHDDAGQLTSATPSSGTATSYAYDSAGRRTAETTGANTTSYTYDTAGRQAKMTVAGGNNQFRAYDPDDNLAYLVNADSSNIVTDAQNLDWDATTPIADLVATTNFTASTSTNTATDLTRNPSAPWASTQSGTTITAVPSDVHGSTTTGSSSTIGRAANYNPWGQPATGTDTLQPTLGYRGELTLGTLTHLKARQYQPGTGEFTTTDPLPGIEGSTTLNNPYHYTNNNPLNHTDPTGLRPDDRSIECPRDFVATTSPPSTYEAIAGASHGVGGCIAKTSTLSRLWELKLSLDDKFVNFVDSPYGKAAFAFFPGTQASDPALYMRCELVAAGRHDGKTWGLGGKCTNAATYTAAALLGTFTGISARTTATNSVDSVAGSEFLDDAIRSPVTRPDLGNLSAKIERQMATRGWTDDLIDEAVTNGRSFPAVNKLGGANSPATRYVSPTTGQSVVIDNATGEVIQVGGPGFRY